MQKLQKISLANSLQVIAVLILFLFGYPGCSSNQETKEPLMDSTAMVTQMPMAENKSHDLKIAMNKLWEDHVTWTRNVILCLVDGLPGADQAVKRLIQNQVDIGNAVKPYYGDEGGNKLTELLKMHIAISADVVAYNKVHDEILKMSAMLADGIIKQFPEKF